jgi:hypothetical protein
MYCVEDTVPKYCLKMNYEKLNGGASVEEMVRSGAIEYVMLANNGSSRRVDASASDIEQYLKECARKISRNRINEGPDALDFGKLEESHVVLLASLKRTEDISLLRFQRPLADSNSPGVHFSSKRAFLKSIGIDIDNLPKSEKFIHLNLEVPGTRQVVIAMLDLEKLRNAAVDIENSEEQFLSISSDMKIVSEKLGPIGNNCKVQKESFGGNYDLPVGILARTLNRVKCFNMLYSGALEKTNTDNYIELERLCTLMKVREVVGIIEPISESILPRVTVDILKKPSDEILKEFFRREIDWVINRKIAEFGIVEVDADTRNMIKDENMIHLINRFKNNTGENGLPFELNLRKLEELKELVSFIEGTFTPSSLNDYAKRATDLAKKQSKARTREVESRKQKGLDTQNNNFSREQADHTKKQSEARTREVKSRKQKEFDKKNNNSSRGRTDVTDNYSLKEVSDTSTSPSRGKSSSEERKTNFNKQPGIKEEEESEKQKNFKKTEKQSSERGIIKKFIDILIGLVMSLFRNKERENSNEKRIDFQQFREATRELDSYTQTQNKKSKSSGHTLY